MHAGDRIAVTVATQSFVGLVDEVGADLLALRCAFGRVEIHVGAGIPISFELVEHATTADARARRTSAPPARATRSGVRVGTLQRPRDRRNARVGRDFVSSSPAAPRRSCRSRTSRGSRARRRRSASQDSQTYRAAAERAERLTPTSDPA